MPKKPGYVAALERTSNLNERLRLAIGGDLAVHEPEAVAMASTLRQLLAVMHGTLPHLKGQQIPELFAPQAPGTIGHEALTAVQATLDYVAEAVLTRNGASLRALAKAVEQDPEGSTDEGRVRAALLNLCAPMAHLGGKPFTGPLTRAELQALVQKVTGINKDQKFIAELCKSLGIRVKNDARGRKKRLRALKGH